MGATISFDACSHSLRTDRPCRHNALSPPSSVTASECTDERQWANLRRWDRPLQGTLLAPAHRRARHDRPSGQTQFSILKIELGSLRVEDAQGAAPNIPFWLGGGERSFGVSRLREAVAARIAQGSAPAAQDWLQREVDLGADAAAQAADDLGRASPRSARCRRNASRRSSASSTNRLARCNGSFTRRGGASDLIGCHHGAISVGAAS